MKKYILILVAIMAVAMPAKAIDPSLYNNLAPAVTAVAANSTNSTAGTVQELYESPQRIRIYVTASGVAATTNGTLTVKISTASGASGTTNEFDTASASYVKVSMSTLGATTNTVSDWFQIDGARYIRVGQIENTFAGAVSNIVVRYGFAR